jgi:selT/selW/selH-like putative selenoprotein
VRATGVEPKVQAGKTGQFDVVVDGQLIFSKQKEGRFPEPDEVLAAIPR